MTPSRRHRRTCLQVRERCDKASNKEHGTTVSPLPAGRTPGKDFSQCSCTSRQAQCRSSETATHVLAPHGAGGQKSGHI